jgi:endonuclease YncB( thermonuclease family)
MLRYAAPALGLLLIGTAASADPCEAIPEQGALPSYLAFGARFSGEVVHVIDGDSLCVAVGPDSASWVEVRLADFSAPESHEPGGAAAKAELTRIALGRKATCTANMRTYDRIASRCAIDGVAIGESLRRAGVREGGNGGGRPSARAALQPAPSGAFQSCAAARAAGAAPIHRGTRGYNPNLDGDNDGIACEPYSGRRR